MLCKFHEVSKGATKSTVGGDVLATFDECILPHPQEMDQNFYVLIKSPPFACTPRGLH